MACFLNQSNDTKITIPRVEECEKCTLYDIRVEIGDVHWTVLHRYNDFVQLHAVLVAEHGVAKDTLPPKKVIGNKDPAFIEKRRSALETYLSTVVRYLQMTMPKELISFLNFHDYDILYMLQNLALQFFLQGESLLMKSKSYTFTPLQLHAISKRLELPCPLVELLDQKLNFSHVLDYCSQLTELVVKGSYEPVKKSNIVPNKLQYEFSAFKILEVLTLVEVNCDKIHDLGSLRSTLTSIRVHNSNIQQLSEVLLCDQLHKGITDKDNAVAFQNITNANFDNNQLTEIDCSIQLLPNIQKLSLENNKLHELQFLYHLAKLKYLNLAANQFREFENLELKLCKIVYLDLSQNHLTSLKGFSKMYSLETLDLKMNKIIEVDEVLHISSLPCLENLILTGNPVTLVIDYRIKVLELFGSRALEICLDNEKSNQKELDKVAILHAIRAAKEGRAFKK